MSKSEYHKRLTLVLGAGASAELGLPLGVDLKNQIAQLLDIRYQGGIRQTHGDYEIHDALKLEIDAHGGRRGDINPYLHAAWKIRDAMPLAISIDNFLESHRGDAQIELCSKLAIVKSILSSERSSILYSKSTANPGLVDFTQTEKSWLNAFFRILSESKDSSSLEGRIKEISIINFNYDRCVEHFLMIALQTYFSLPPERAVALVKSIDIYHPYGTVGSLPWQGGNETIEFGAETIPRRLLQLSKQIKTFSEGTDPKQSNIHLIRNTISLSERVIYLGFAFHRLNLDLLMLRLPYPKVDHVKQVFGTGFGISASDCELIKRELISRSNLDLKRIALQAGMKCKELFQEYPRALSLA